MGRPSTAGSITKEYNRPVLFSLHVPCAQTGKLQRRRKHHCLMSAPSRRLFGGCREETKEKEDAFFFSADDPVLGSSSGLGRSTTITTCP